MTLSLSSARQYSSLRRISLYIFFLFGVYIKTSISQTLFFLHETVMYFKKELIVSYVLMITTRGFVS